MKHSPLIFLYLSTTPSPFFAGACELLFWNVATGEREPDANAVKNAMWNPNTCPLSWETIGIWGASDDLTDINAVEVCDDLDLIVTVDDSGKK